MAFLFFCIETMCLGIDKIMYHNNFIVLWLTPSPVYEIRMSHYNLYNLTHVYFSDAKCIFNMYVKSVLELVKLTVVIE